MKSTLLLPLFCVTLHPPKWNTGLVQSTVNESWFGLAHTISGHVSHYKIWWQRHSFWLVTGVNVLCPQFEQASKWAALQKLDIQYQIYEGAQFSLKWYLVVDLQRQPLISITTSHSYDLSAQTQLKEGLSQTVRPLSLINRTEAHICLRMHTAESRNIQCRIYFPVSVKSL